MSTTGGSGGGEDPGGDKRGSVGRQMVPRWDKRAVGKGRGQRRVDVSDDLDDSSSFQHSGPKKGSRGEKSESTKKKLQQKAWQKLHNTHF